MPRTTCSLKMCGSPYWRHCSDCVHVLGSVFSPVTATAVVVGVWGVGLPAQRPSSGDAPFTLAGSAVCTASGTAKPASDSLSPRGPPSPASQGFRVLGLVTPLNDQVQAQPASLWSRNGASIATGPQSSANKDAPSCQPCGWAGMQGGVSGLKAAQVQG